MKIKICGLKYQQDLDAASLAGADYCGFIFHRKSPRYIEPQHAAKLNSHNMLRVGVFVTTDYEEIHNIMEISRLDYIQLHGNQDKDLAARLGPDKIIRVIWPEMLKSLDNIEKFAREWAPYCRKYLLDSGNGGGGTGKTFNWQLLAQMELPWPWFLAGGLHQANIAKAINTCLPQGVDLNSGVEDKPGIKNPQKIMDISNLIKDLF